MTLESVTEKITKKMSRASSLNARVKFDFGDDGIIFVDATQTPPMVSNIDEDADTTLICSIATFDAIMDGRQDPNVAFVMGKLKVQGSMGLALKLNGFLED